MLPSMSPRGTALKVIIFIALEEGLSWELEWQTESIMLMGPLLPSSNMI
jgi:hypothetical protein